MAQLFDSIVTAPPRPGAYATLMADPPWLERGGGQIKRGADRHYPLMSTDEICALPVSSWMAPDAHGYIWVTNNFLPDGLRVMAAWGFRFVTKIDWFKGEIPDVDVVAAIEQLRTLGQEAQSPGAANLAERIWDVADLLHRSRLSVDPMSDNDLQTGLGQYYRGATESCLFGVRGRVPYRFTAGGKRAQGRTGFHAPRGQHSAKPETMRAMVERVSPGPYLEMFARRPAPNWDLWGNQAPMAEAR